MPLFDKDLVNMMVDLSEAAYGRNGITASEAIQTVNANNFSENWRVLGANELNMEGSFNENGYYDSSNHLGWLGKAATFLFGSAQGLSAISNDPFGERSMVISFRGTENLFSSDGIRDFLNNFTTPAKQIALFGEFIRNSLSYATANGVDKVYFTGHSLGGSVAEAAISIYGNSAWFDGEFQAVVFASPGVPLSFSTGVDDRILSFAHTDDLVANLDGLSTNAVRHSIYIPPDSLNLFAEHSLHVYDNSIEFITASDLFEGLTASHQVNVLQNAVGPLTFTQRVYVVGGYNRDSVTGSGYDDLIDGMWNDDSLRGGSGDDHIIGGTGEDKLFGDADDDIIKGGSGDDDIDGGSENSEGDLVKYDLSRSYYGIVSANGTVTVTELRFGGYTDTVRHVEWFEFAGGLRVDVDNLVIDDPDPLPPLPDPPDPPPSSAMPVLSCGGFALTEGDSGVRTYLVRVHLSKVATTDVTFNYALLGRDTVGWAQSGSDFQFRGGAAFIPQGSLFIDLQVPIIGDTKVEGTEALEFLFSSITGATFASGGSIYDVDGTILDNEAPSEPPPPPPPPPPAGPVYLSLVARDASLVEGADGTYTEFRFDAVRTGDLSVQTKIGYEVLGFGASPAESDDFEGSVFPIRNVTFPVGLTSDRFVVRVKGDALTEAHEAFQVRLFSRSSGVIVTDDTAAVTIRNDDGSTLPSPAGPVYVSIREFDAVKSEGTSSSGTTPFVFELTREGDLSQETQVDVRIVSSGTPTSSTSGSYSDFSQPGARSVTFAIGQSVAYVEFDGRRDAVNEPDEPLTVRLSRENGYDVIFTDETARGLVLNDDGPAPPLVTAPPIAVRETDTDQTAYVRVQLSHTTPVSVTMDYEIYAFVDSQIPATADDDFVAQSGNISVAPGSTFVDIPVTIKGDVLSEGVELVNVRLTNLVNGYLERSLDYWDTAVVILDDDGDYKWPGGVEFTSADYVNLGLVAPYSTQKVHYWLDETTSHQLFSFEVDDPIVAQLTTNQSTHFLFSQTGELIGAEAARINTVDVSSVGNGLAGGAVLQTGRYFLLVNKSSAATGGPGNLTLSGAPAPDLPPLLQFYPHETFGTEDRGVHIGLRLSVAPQSDVTADIEFRSLTATAGIDFRDTSLSMRILAGDDRSDAQFVRLFNDDDFEGVETFEVVIKNVSGALLPNRQSEWTSTYTIFDDDVSPVPVFTITGLTADRAEGTGTPRAVTFEIIRPYGGEANAATVDWAVTPGGANPARTNDFLGNLLPAGTASFAPGEISKTITIQFAADSRAELDEGFKVTLANPSDGFSLFKATAQGTIRNDDGFYQPGYLGEDDVESAVTYFMSPSERNFLASGTGNIDITGNMLSNNIAGNNANNRIFGLGRPDFLSGEGGADDLIGGGGGDLMHGGRGNDTYYVDHQNDEAFEGTDAGYDRVISGVSFQLSSDIERLDLVGSAGIDGTGNELDNQLTGNGFRNTLSGQGGNDQLQGRKDNDVLNGGTGADTLNGGLGTDSASYEGSATRTIADLQGLFANAMAAQGDMFIDIENVVGSDYNDVLGGNDDDNILIGGGGADNLEGRDGSDWINGGMENDVLDGGAGTDTMVGGAGSDTYIVNSAGDVTSETDGGGADKVRASVTWTLGADIESLVLVGSADINAVGNDLNNQLNGNVGKNTLNGERGNDSMYGGAGDDTYIIDSGGDVASETGGSGVDNVRASVTWTLAADFEDLALTRSGDINGFGNELGNRVVGNAGNNTLNTGAGDDHLNGGSGRDVLVGGAGADEFRFASVAQIGIAETARDIIRDFGHLVDTIDLLAIDADVAALGNQSFEWRGGGPINAAAQLRYHHIDRSDPSEDRTIISGNINGDLAPDFKIELVGLRTLSIADFNL